MPHATLVLCILRLLTALALLFAAACSWDGSDFVRQLFAGPPATNNHAAVAFAIFGIGLLIEGLTDWRASAARADTVRSN